MHTPRCRARAEAPRLSVRRTGLTSSPIQILYGGQVVAHVNHVRDRNEWYWATQPTSPLVPSVSTHTTPFSSIDAAKEDAMRYLRQHFQKRRDLNERGRRVADFNTLDDLIAHAAHEGATHVLHIDDEIHLYFRRSDGKYEKAEVWQKDGYWHTQAPGSRAIVKAPPPSAKPITGAGRRAAEEARRGPSHINELRALLPPGYSVETWSPGDGVTRYRFFENAPPNQDYFGPNNGIHTALGYKDAVAFADGLKSGSGERNKVSKFHRMPGSGGRSMRDYIAVDRRGRTIAGPFKTYGPAKDAAGTAGTVEYIRPRAAEVRQDRSSWSEWRRDVIDHLRGFGRQDADQIFDRHEEEMRQRFRNHDRPYDTAHNFAGSSDVGEARRAGGTRGGPARKYHIIDQVQDGLWVQVGHFSSKAAAERFRKQVPGKTRVTYTFPSHDYPVRSAGAAEARRPRHAGPKSATQQAESAGHDYALDQINDSYFTDWVRGQLIEAEKMRQRDPSSVLPFETKADAMVIARNMFQDLEFDTKRQLRAREIEQMLGIDRATPDVIDSFYDGFKKTLSESRDWLADELLEIKQEMGGARVAETRRRG